MKRKHRGNPQAPQVKGAGEVVSGRRATATSRNNWTPDEDQRLRAAVKLHGEQNWKAIASVVRTRNYEQCYQRWRKVLIPGLVKGTWSADEDENLINVKEELPTSDWGKISARVPGRTDKQCRERYCNHLDPKIDENKPFTREEDEIILKTQADLGETWSKTALDLPGRNGNAVRRQWKALLKEKSRGDGSSGKKLKLTIPGPARTSAEETPTTSARSNRVCLSPVSTASVSTSSFDSETGFEANEPRWFEWPAVPCPAARPAHLGPGASSSRELDFYHMEPAPRPPVVAPSHGGRDTTSGYMPQTIYESRERVDSGRGEEVLYLKWPPTISSGGGTGGSVGTCDGSVAYAEAYPSSLQLPHVPSSVRANSPFVGLEQEGPLLEVVDWCNYLEAVTG